MGQVLKNKNLELRIDFPLENYNFSRFDWTGKITDVKFKGLRLSSVEDPNCKKENLLGRGFYNEFGIASPLGFDETDMGGWFHKIGVGLLKKVGDVYWFDKSYEIKPAAFRISKNENRVLIHCESALANGYAYELKKEIKVLP